MYIVIIYYYVYTKKFPHDCKCNAHPLLVILWIGVFQFLLLDVITVAPTWYYLYHKHTHIRWLCWSLKFTSSHTHTHALILHMHTHTHTHTAVRIYHRRGARRWKKVRRINGHAFVAKRFQMAFCDKCEDRIWGLGRQGYRCESCKMTVHKRCCYYLQQDEICKGHPVWVSYFLSLSLSLSLSLLFFL